MNITRSAHAAVVGLGLLSVGLWIGGATGRVHALVRAAASSPQISPIAGSTSALSREIVLDGTPTRMRRCKAPAGWSVSQVRDHYETLAEAQSRFESGERVPYLAMDQYEGASVLWTSVKDGRRRGVIVQRDQGVVNYTLLDAEAVPATAETPSQSSVVLPGGAAGPAGSRAALSVVDGGSSYSFFEAPGSPATVAEQVRKSLAGVGYETDGDKQDAYADVRVGGSSSRIVVPFKGKDRKGFIVVAAQGMGSSRATVVVR